MKIPHSIPYDTIAIDDPERFSRMMRLMPWGSRALLLSFGAFVLSSLAHLLVGRSITVGLLVVGIAAFVVAFVLQTMLYRINRDRSILFMLASCAGMLALQGFNIWMPRTMPEMAWFFGAWLATGIASVWLAWKGAAIAKAQAKETEERTRALVASMQAKWQTETEADEQQR